MKDILNSGRVLGRSEMKKIMAGSGDDCESTTQCPSYKPCHDCSSGVCTCSNCCLG